MQQAGSQRVRITCPNCRSELTSSFGKVKCGTCCVTLVVTDPNMPRKPATDYSSLGKPLLVFGLVALGFTVIATILALLVGGNGAKERARIHSAASAARERDHAAYVPLRAESSDVVTPVVGHIWPCTPNAADL